MTAVTDAAREWSERTYPNDLGETAEHRRIAAHGFRAGARWRREQGLRPWIRDFLAEYDSGDIDHRYGYHDLVEDLRTLLNSASS